MRTLASVDFRDKRALVRVDFNVPLSTDRTVLDDARIRAAVPTLQRLARAGCACVLITHLGRPGGKRVEDLALPPMAERLSALLPDADVRLCDEVVGPHAREMAQALGPRKILLLQNLRFHPGEKDDDAAFAAELASLGDVYVNDGGIYLAGGIPPRVLPLLRERPFLEAVRQKGRLESSPLLRDPSIHVAQRPKLALIGAADVAKEAAR